MAKSIRVYDSNNKVITEGEGTVIELESLTPNTDYKAGDFKVSFFNEAGESKQVNVPAFKTKPIAVTGVSLSKSTLTVEEGATSSLSATVAPNNASDKSVTYSSSDKSVATVDNSGKVTGVKAGTADITVTTNSGSKTAKCSVTVTAKEETA